MKKHLASLAALAAATMMAGAVRTASAALQFQLGATGAVPITITDNGLGDSNPAIGQITYAGSIGNFSTVITVGTSNSPGANGVAILQTHTISVRETTTERDTLTFAMSDTGFTNPSGTGLALGSSFSGTFLSAVAGENVTFQSYADATDTAFGKTGTTAGLHTATLANGSPAPVAFTTADRTATFNSSGPYSMTDVTTISLSQNGQANVSGTTDMTVPPGAGVPEPASLSVLGLGILAFAAKRRRKTQ